MRLPRPPAPMCCARAAPRSTARSPPPPASATLDRFDGQAEIPFRGIVPATLTTPGAVASFGEAHARYGKLPLTRCLQAAIHYARDGYPVSERLARWISE